MNDIVFLVEYVCDLQCVVDPFECVNLDHHKTFVHTGYGYKYKYKELSTETDRTNAYSNATIAIQFCIERSVVNIELEFKIFITKVTVRLNAKHPKKNYISKVVQKKITISLFKLLCVERKIRELCYLHKPMINNKIFRP